jgi:peroxiredoxin (alkyl hydroperoxide reductase subunit C)
VDRSTCRFEKQIGPQGAQRFGAAVPVEVDAGAPRMRSGFRHVKRHALAAIEPSASDGRNVRLDELPTRSVAFVYPGIGGHLGRDDRLEEWTAIPGARGCTSEACSFRDELAEFRAAGVEVFGLASESSSSQREHAQRLGLSYPLLSDDSLRLSEALSLPTFDFHGRRHFKRLTLIAAESMIEAALYPVFPPDEGAAQALRWLRQRPRAS